MPQCILSGITVLHLAQTFGMGRARSDERRVATASTFAIPAMLVLTIMGLFRVVPPSRWRVDAAKKGKCGCRTFFSYK
jgi:hypothetical protein